MDLDDLRTLALRVHDLYDAVNRRDRGRTWTREEYLLGFVGDVGDLAKLVLAREGARPEPPGLAGLDHELADCLWSVLVLAHHYQVDLERAFTATMAELTSRLRAELGDPPACGP